MRVAELSVALIESPDTSENALRETVAEFTEAVIQDELSSEELQTRAEDIQMAFALSQDELIAKVYGRLLLLAGFCSCRP